MKKKFTMLLAALLACSGVAKAEVTDLPQITTDLENPIYYTIYNTRSSEPGGLMYYAGDAIGLKDGCTSLTLEDKYKFYFTGSHEELYVHNAATDKKLASVDSWTTEGIAWTVTAPTASGLAFGPKGETGYVFWNDKNYSTDESTSDFTVWSNTDAGSIFVCEKAEEFAFPVETDKFYVIECPLFENVQGVKKALYVAESGKAAWNTEDLTNHNHYWVPTVNEDGTVALKNFGTGTYLSATDGTMSETVVNATLNALGNNCFNIILTNVVHANGHGGGVNASGSLTNWGGAVGSASAWRFVQKEDPTTLAEVVVKYSFTYDGAEKYTQETTVLVGENYPNLNISFPYGVTSDFVLPEGSVSGDVELNFTLTVEKELPFKTAVDANSITTWYYAKMHTNLPGYLGDIAEDNTINVASGKSSDVASDNFVWGFVGNVFDGVTVVNKGTGLQLTSTGSDKVTLTENGTPFFVSTTRETGENTEYAFCLSKDASSDYVNADYGAKSLSHWWDNDAGSSIFLTEYEETAVTISDVDWATMYLGYATYIPEGVNVYAVTGVESSYVTLTQIEGVIPENTGVLLENAGEHTFVKAAKDNATVSDNLLQGSVVNTYVEGTAYVLSAKNGIGLYKAQLNKDAEGNDGTTHFLNNANKAYLPVSSNAPMFSLERGEGTTNIESTVNGQQSTVIYDLTGRRVEKMEKGIYIVNGKKIIK